MLLLQRRQLQEPERHTQSGTRREAHTKRHTQREKEQTRATGECIRAALNTTQAIYPNTVVSVDTQHPCRSRAAASSGQNSHENNRRNTEQTQSRKNEEGAPGPYRTARTRCFSADSRDMRSDTRSLEARFSFVTCRLKFNGCGLMQTATTKQAGTRVSGGSFQNKTRAHA